MISLPIKGIIDWNYIDNWSQAVGVENQNKDLRSQLSNLRTQSAIAEEKMMEQLEEYRGKLKKESGAHAETKENLKSATDRLDAKLMEAKVKSLLELIWLDANNLFLIFF